MMKRQDNKDIVSAETVRSGMTSVDKKGLKARVVAFLRDRQTWGFFVSIAVMAIISIAFFYPDNFEGNDLRQHDMQQGLANGQEVKLFEEATGEQSRWTNSLFSGMPTFQISPTYPSDSMFRWITNVYGLGLPAPSNLLFMMMLGFMILMMTMRIRWEYGLIGAIAWGFSTYFIIIIGAGHIWKFVTLSYIPPTIGGILMVYRGRYLSGGALTALFAMMQITSNHVQMTYYFTFVVAAIVIAYFIHDFKRRQTRRWAVSTLVVIAAGALAVAANLPNLYHTARYAAETQRGQSELTAGSAEHTGGLSLDYLTQYSYGKNETWTLLIPNVKGGASIKPEAGKPTLLPLADVDGASDYTDMASRTYLPRLPQYFGEPEMTNGPVYVGAIIFALFILGCIVVRGPLKWALLAVTVVSIMLAWGRNFMGLTELFVDIVPMYSKFRTPESILVIAEFTMPLLGVMGLAKVMGAGADRGRYVKPLIISFGSSGLICLAGVIAPSVFGLSDGTSANALAQAPTLYNSIIDLRASMVRADSFRSLAFIILAGAPLVIYAMGRLRAAWAVAATGVLVAIDLYTVNKRYLDSDSFYHPTPFEASAVDAITPTAADLAILEDTDPNYRVLDLDRFGEAAPSYFHKMIGGYHAAKLGRYQEMIDHHILNLNPAVINMLNARYIVYQGQAQLNGEALGNAWFVDQIDYVDGAKEEIEALDYFDPSTQAYADKRFKDILGQASPKSAGDTIFETSYAPNRIAYKAVTSDDAVAVFSEVYFPWGWEATIDGKTAEIGRVNYILRALRVPAGEHEIVMTFDPQSVKTTVAVATVAVIIIFLTVIAAAALAFKPCKGAKRDADDSSDF